MPPRSRRSHLLLFVGSNALTETAATRTRRRCTLFVIVDQALFSYGLFLIILVVFVDSTRSTRRGLGPCVAPFKQFSLPQGFFVSGTPVPAFKEVSAIYNDGSRDSIERTHAAAALASCCGRPLPRLRIEYEEDFPLRSFESERSLCEDDERCL